MIAAAAALALHLVYSQPSAAPVNAMKAPTATVSTSRSSVSVSFHEANDNLYADFTVKTPEINAKSELGANEYPYMFDAVELFVSVDGEKNNLPYFEFELSPYNQTFEVKIIDPTKERINGVDVGLIHSVEDVPMDQGREWIGHLEIPLKLLGWNGDRSHVIGNAFAVLGPKGQRTYWSLSLPAQKKPNFHLPQFFKPLLK